MSSGDSDKTLKLRKLYYSIGEVADMTGIHAHVLRYWEGEFKQLSPKKGRNGSRLYQEKDIKMIRRIQELLYEKRFTISGAKSQLNGSEKIDNSHQNGKGTVLKEIRTELKDILKLLDS